MNKDGICLTLAQSALLYLRLMAPVMEQLCVLSNPCLALLVQTQPGISLCRKLHLSSDGCVIAGAAI